jgi:hypothetical protein
MSDEDVLRALAQGELPADESPHRAHLRLAWTLLRRDGFEAGALAVADALRTIAARHGAAAKYHETLTAFWIRIVSHAMRREPAARSLEELLERFPLLADPSLPRRHWSGETLAGDAARARWVEPDLRPLPAT